MKLGFCARGIYIMNLLSGLDGLFGPYIYRGGPYNVTTSVNVLTETVRLGQPPQLIDINRDGFVTDRGGCWPGYPTSNNRGVQPG